MSNRFMRSGLADRFARRGHGRAGGRSARKAWRAEVEPLEGRALLAFLSVGPTSNTGHLAGSQSEEAIAINPLNPKEVAVFANDNAAAPDGMYYSYTTDGGTTWNSRVLGDGNDGLGFAFSDPSLAWDKFGNLFASYVDDSATHAVILVSNDAGATFTKLASFANVADQPKLAVGPGGAGAPGALWMEYLDSSFNVGLIGIPVNGRNSFGTPTPEEFTVATDTSNFGKLSVGPDGQVMMTYQAPENNAGPSSLYFQLDPDGLGPAGLSNPVNFSTTNVGGFYPIPPQPTRTVDAEVEVAYDQSNGPHRGRVYAAYLNSPGVSDPDTNVYLRYSDNDGQTWSSPVKVNDDTGTNSQFFPRVRVDPVTGFVGLSWFDARNDPGNGPGDTDGKANTDTEVFATASLDGGRTFVRNVQVARGPSNSESPANANTGNNFGDYMGLDFYNMTLWPAWCDNSTILAGNTDRPEFDIAAAPVTVQGLLSLSAQSLQASENTPFTGRTVATFHDPSGRNQASDYTATIDWGDSTAPTQGVVTSQGGNRFTVLADHEYMEGGTYTVTVRLASALDGQSYSDSAPATVADLPILASGSTSTTATEGVASTGILLGTFQDTDPDSLGASAYTVTIDWKDGTAADPARVVAQPGHNQFAVYGSHILPGSRPGSPTPVSFHVVGPGGGTADAATLIDVADSALTGRGATAGAVEGRPMTAVVATFEDADPRTLAASYYKATIDWGDGSPKTVGAINRNNAGGFDVVGSHTYQFHQGGYPITVAIADADVSRATILSHADVQDAPLTSTGTGLTLSEGTNFRGVVAFFSDGNPLSLPGQFSAQVAWGDGTTSTGQVLDNGIDGFVVKASHTYGAGGTPINTTFPMSVTIASTTGPNVTTAPGTVFVRPAPIQVAAAPITATAAVAFSGVVGTLASADPTATAADFGAVVDWGDGTSSPATVAAAPGGGFTITGGHTYFTYGQYQVYVVASTRGTQASDRAEVSVADAPIVGNAAGLSGTEGVTYAGPVATFTTPNRTAGAGDFATVITWGDGTTTAGQVVAAAGATGQFVVTGAHVYNQGGAYPLSVTVRSAGGSSATVRGTASVADKLTPVTLSAGLPASGVTSNRTPTLVGTAQPGSTVELLVQMAGQPGPVVVGTGAAGSDGSWTITSAPLGDGTYTFLALATDGGGRPSSPLTPIGATTVDTVGPTVLNSTLNPRTGTLTVTLQDQGFGIDQAVLANSSSYVVQFPLRRFTRTLPLRVASVSQPDGPNGPSTVTIDLGGRLRRGSYVLTIGAATMTDRAGNPLDEHFLVPFPQVGGGPGTDYVARFDTNGRTASAPQQYVSTDQALAAQTFRAFLRSKHRSHALFARRFRRGRG